VQTTGQSRALGASGYAGLEPTNPPNWHHLIACDLCLNALAAGLFLATAAAEFAGPAAFAPLVTLGYPLALVLLIGEALCLVLDLGDPLRFHHMLRVFKPTSPMSFGTWCLTAYSVPLTIILAIDLFAALGWVSPDSAAVTMTHRGLVLIALPLAFASAAYKGVLFSTTAQPGWRDARWLGAYHTTGAILFGAAVVLLIAVATGNLAAVAVVRLAVAVLAALNLVPLALLARELAPALVRAYGPAQRMWFGTIWLLAGVLAPAALLATGGAFATALAALLVLAAGFAVRWLIVQLPHAIHRVG